MAIKARTHRVHSVTSSVSSVHENYHYQTCWEKLLTTVVNVKAPVHARASARMLSIRAAVKSAAAPARVAVGRARSDSKAECFSFAPFY